MKFGDPKPRKPIESVKIRKPINEHRKLRVKPSLHLILMHKTIKLLFRPIALSSLSPPINKSQTPQRNITTNKLRSSLLTSQLPSVSANHPLFFFFMAGLQQYNFFPTDLLYPRPPPSVAPAALPLPPPKPETSSDPHLQNQPRSFANVPPSTTSSPLAISQKAKSPFEVDKKKLSPLSTDPLSLLFWVADDDASETS